MAWRLSAPEGMPIYRRKAHLVVWDTDMLVTVAPWPLYWSLSQMRTYACVSEVGPESLWLPVADLIGYWSWLTNRIAGLRIVDGYGPMGACGPLVRYVVPHPVYMVEDTDTRYWYADRTALWLPSPDPLAHT